MTPKTIIALSVGTASMLMLMLIIGVKYRLKLWKCAPIALMLTVTGTIGTYIWFFVENSWFGGRSYYGAVFIVPIVFIAISKLMRIPYGDILDLCAPSECIMLAIMKYQCLIDGCCGGRVMYYATDGAEVLFPSQMVELVNALVLVIVLMIMAFIPRFRGKLYPWYLVLYGVTRFVLNWFRADNDPVLICLTRGCLWSLIAIFIGVLWLCDRKIAIIKVNKTTEQVPEE